MIAETGTLRVEVYRVPRPDPFDVSVHRFPVQNVLWLLAPPGLNNGQIFVLVLDRLTFTEARAVAIRLGLLAEGKAP
jgi:hypothetical protein